MLYRLKPKLQHSGFTPVGSGNVVKNLLCLVPEDLEIVGLTASGDEVGFAIAVEVCGVDEAVVVQVAEARKHRGCCLP